MYSRGFLKINEKNISYIDFGGTGFPIIALHGHFGNACMFSGISRALSNEWRVIAIDQQGHGWSDHSKDYSRNSYINDIVQVFHKLNLNSAILYGHSLGGVNAYQIAARYPEFVKAMIIEDIGAVINDNLSFVIDWPERFASIRDMREFLKLKGIKEDTYFLESLREYDDGWGFKFNFQDMIRSQELLNGDYWSDWLTSSCPTLLLHGHKTWVMTTEHAREMAAKRPNTKLVEFPDCGHTIRDENPEGLYREVRIFLEDIVY